MNVSVAIKLAAAFVREGVDCKDRLSCDSCPLHIYANTSYIDECSVGVSVVTSALCERDIKSPHLVHRHYCTLHLA